MAVALRSELERRLEELSKARTERDAYLIEKEAYEKKFIDLETSTKRNEQAFKKALETDRSKIQQEVKSKVSRLKSLEGEKEELLKEMNELMNQSGENHREMVTLRNEAEESKKNEAELAEQLMNLKVKYSESLQELKACSRKEQDLRDHSTKLENQFREDITRLEHVVKGIYFLLLSLSNISN